MKYCVLLCLLLCGCGLIVSDVSQKLDLKGERVSYRVSSGSSLITVSLDGGTFDDVLDVLPENVSLCVSESLRFSRFALDVNGVDLETFLFAVSKSAGCRVSRYGDLFVFEGGSGEKALAGSSDPGINNESAFVHFFKVPYFKPAEVIKAVQGAVYVNGDNYICRCSVGDAVRNREIIEGLLGSLPCEYAFELFFISREKIEELSADVSASWKGVWNINRSAGAMSVNEWSSLIGLLGTFEARRSRNESWRHVCGVFREGGKYTCTVGDSVPYIKRTVQENGSVLDSDINYIDIGVKVQIGCSGSTAGVVDLDLNVNEISGYTNTYPQKRGSSLNTEFVVSGDDRRFVGSFMVESGSRAVMGYSKKKTEWLVFCRVLRVSAGQSVSFSS